MTNKEKQMLQDFNQDAEAFKGCLFLCLIIGLAIGTGLTIYILNN